MQLICKGACDDVEELLVNAPPYHEFPSFTDARVFKFSMFNAEANKFKEEKTCSPVAIASCVGDLRMLDVILAYMQNVEIEYGLEVCNKTQALLKSNIFASVKRKTPLQMACSMGLFAIVARLLKEGANPDLVK